MKWMLLSQTGERVTTTCDPEIVTETGNIFTKIIAYLCGHWELVEIFDKNIDGKQSTCALLQKY